MPYCYKCGEEVDETSGFCPSCGANLSTAESEVRTGTSVLSGILIIFAIVGIVAGVFLLAGGLIAAIMNPFIESASAGGRVWAIGYLAWMIFYPTGLIEHCFLIGIISLGVGIGSSVLSDKV